LGILILGRQNLHKGNDMSAGEQATKYDQVEIPLHVSEDLAKGVASAAQLEGVDIPEIAGTALRSIVRSPDNRTLAALADGRVPKSTCAELVTVMAKISADEAKRLEALTRAHKTDTNTVGRLALLDLVKKSAAKDKANKSAIRHKREEKFSQLRRPQQPFQFRSHR
jgi:hypothetical protein